jgi:hypothetical protein
VLKCGSTIRYPIATILAAHWWEFIARYHRWIRPVVFENVRKTLACRTAALGCHVYMCPGCGHVEVKPHSCKSRFCPTCGKHATDVWADQVLGRLLDVPYHHLVLSIPWQLRIVILINRPAGLKLLFDAATAAVQQWARDVHGMRMGMVLVAHTFGSDLKWHPHVHLIVTGGGLSLDGKRWIATDPRFLMHESGLKKRWKYHVTSRMRAAHRQGAWRFPRSAQFLNRYPCFTGMLNRLWGLTWYAHIGASLLDPRFSVRYIGRYTKRAVLAEYRITHYDGRWVRFSFRDYAAGGRTAVATVSVHAFIGRLIRHIPDKYFPMVRHRGLFCNRWRQRYLTQARRALRLPAPSDAAPPTPRWAQRQKKLTGTDPLICPRCHTPLRLVLVAFGPWDTVAAWRPKDTPGNPPRPRPRLLPVPAALRTPG